jgi:hypothetical protein
VKGEYTLPLAFIAILLVIASVMAIQIRETGKSAEFSGNIDAC